MPTAQQQIRQKETSFIDKVADAYLARSFVPDAEQVTKWRYRNVIPLLHRLHGRFTGLQRRSLRVSGERMVWLEGGNPAGEPMLLLHGFGACKENWLPILPFLWRRYQLFIPDLPGWGESAFDAASLYGFDQQVARLADWAEKVLPVSVHIVGSSMGGGIAALLAARHQRLARSLTLLDAAGVSGDQLTPFEAGLIDGENSLLAKDYAGVVSLLSSTMYSNRLPRLMAPLAWGDLTSRHQVNQHLFRQMLANPPAEELPSFSQVTCPTLIIWGTDDQVIHPSCGETYQQLIPHAKLKYLRGIGHMPMVEAPRLTARLMRRFTRQIAHPALPTAKVKTTARDASIAQSA